MHELDGEHDVDHEGGDGTPRRRPISRRSALLGLTALGAGGLVLPGGYAAADLLDDPFEISRWDAVGDRTYDMFRGTGRYGNHGNYSNGPELVTYANPGSKVRGGLWVHDSSAGSVENGSYTRPFHRGDWGHNLRRVRVESRRSFRQPMAVVIKGKTIWYDPRGGDVVDGIERSGNGGMKIHVGHHDNRHNYAITLIRKTGAVVVSRQFGSRYKRLGSTYYPTPKGTVRTFKVTWINNRIKVYHRRTSDPYDNSHDRLILSVYAPGSVNGVAYNNSPVGMYLDGAAVRMYDYHVWQGHLPLHVWQESHAR